MLRSKHNKKQESDEGRRRQIDRGQDRRHLPASLHAQSLLLLTLDQAGGRWSGHEPVVAGHLHQILSAT